MVEAKYIEDILPRIKATLEARGFINEHDRLGHFESKVPLDVFLGLAQHNKNVRVFGIQFKAPKRRANSVSWDLTHTKGQYEKIVRLPDQFIFYCLPWYTDPSFSGDCLSNVAFVFPSALPQRHLNMIENNYPLSAKIIKRICSLILLKKEVNDKVGDLIWNDGIKNSFGKAREVLNAVHSFTYPIHSCHNIEEFEELISNTKNQGNKSYEVDRIREALPELKRLLALGFPFEYFQSFFSDIMSFIFFRDFELGIKEIKRFADFSSFFEKQEHYPLDIQLGSITLSKYYLNDTARKLKFTSRLRCNRGDGIFSWKANVEIDCDKGESQFSSWEELLSKIENGEIGIEVDSLLDEKSNSDLVEVLALDKESILVWYDRVKRVFYAIEAKRLAFRKYEDVLSTLTDPLLSGISPEIRKRIYHLSKEKGLSPATVLAEILHGFFGD